MHGVLRKTILSLCFCEKPFLSLAAAANRQRCLVKEGREQGGRDVNKGLERLLLACEQGLLGISDRSWSTDT
jgi:hypothetical protein